MNAKVWKIEQQEESVITQLYDTLEVSPIVARLLYNRGYYEPIAAGRFLRKETGVFHDPFLLCDMDRAVKRICAPMNEHSANSSAHKIRRTSVLSSRTRMAQ